MFSNLVAKTGADSIGVVRTFLDRRAVLRDGTDSVRASTREQDKEAVALLAARRIVDDAEDARLDALATPCGAAITVKRAELAPGPRQRRSVATLTTMRAPSSSL